jgi:mannosyltransferase
VDTGSRPAVVSGRGTARRVPAGWVPPVLAVVLLAVLVAPAQVLLRQPAGHIDDLRTLAATLTAEQRPGDAVLFVPRRYQLFVGVYARPYERLPDLTYAPGHEAPRTVSQFRTVAGRYQRIWMVSSTPGKNWNDDERCQALLKDKRFTRAPSRAFGHVMLTLFTRK